MGVEKVPGKERVKLSRKNIMAIFSFVSILLILACIFLLIKIRGTTIPPHVDMSIEARNIDGENVRITVTHNGGDSIPYPDKSIVLRAENSDGNITEVSVTNWPQTFSQGDVVSGTYTYGQNPTGKTIEVIVYYGLGIFDTKVQIE